MVTSSVLLDRLPAALPRALFADLFDLMDALTLLIWLHLARVILRTCLALMPGPLMHYTHFVSTAIAPEDWFVMATWMELSRLAIARCVHAPAEIWPIGERSTKNDAVISVIMLSIELPT